MCECQDFIKMWVINAGNSAEDKLALTLKSAASVTKRPLPLLVN